MIDEDQKMRKIVQMMTMSHFENNHSKIHKLEELKIMKTHMLADLLNFIPSRKKPAKLTIQNTYRVREREREIQ